MLGAGGGAGKSAMEEWAAALIECVMWGAAKSKREMGNDVVAKELLGEWLGRVWKAYLGVDGAGAAGKGVQTLSVVHELSAALIRLGSSDEGERGRFYSNFRGTDHDVIHSALPSTVECHSRLFARFDRHPCVDLAVPAGCRSQFVLHLRLVHPRD
jgi:hypothetical protein